ncbi:hypothetical protein HF313_17095 [Massilia atriviolacea]|uniref:Uncharacterized protein n=1 Tax=Massilia atriviolacea TaxID=2495579 RepID=A0A430HTU9_9BURK|nr:hypothetical protein [Massilia atriviolacea]RSZ60991.1 hypothetical protein EJB06_02315 [Massilia atriviolacea]
MSTKQTQERSVTLEIQASITERQDDLPAIVGYAFSQGGALLDLQPLDKEGRARLAVPVGAEGQLVRVVLGPEVGKDALDIGEVLRRGGIDRHVPVRPNTERVPPLLFELGPDRWRRWIGRLCVVNGTLLKRIVSGGVVLNLPVCNASVDIDEVDPWPIIIAELPQIELDRLRDIVDGPWPPLRLPIPPRPPEPFLGADMDATDPLLSVALNPQPLPPRQLHAHALQLADPHAIESHAVDRTALNALTLPADLVLAARAPRMVFERAVLSHLDLLRPLLCWLFPFPVRRTRIATVTTDECGHFRALIWRSIFNVDQPDLYFTARQRIWPGFWVTIYEPKPVICHTWWNYVCGSEVTLVTTHPLARACPPCPPVVAPNNWVLFMAIGNTSVWRIHGANDTTRIGAPGHQPDQLGLLDDSAPWGGSLRPRLEFDSSLRNDLGVRYYRVSYKRSGEDEHAWRPSIDAINRHYTHEVAGDLILEQYPLGPRTVGSTAHLYEIPPALPPTGQWSIPNAVLDTQNAVIPTTAVAPGVPFDANGVASGPDQGGTWQIRIELFDAAGTLVDPEALGIKWRVPASATLSGTIQTRDAALLGLVDAALNRMVVTVRVDNNPTFARIDAPAVGGSTAADECGVMHYGESDQAVAVPFLALQRNRFATYSFYVQRGAVSPPEYGVAGTAAANAAGMPGAIPPSPPAAPLPTVGSLLDACPLAGFTEQLYVAHTGTDGWSRLSGYDNSAARAFVLAP